MSKKIDRAAKDLMKAMHDHAAVASDKKAGKNKLLKASGKLRAAAIAYGSIVSARKGTASPFAEIPDPRLDGPTVDSLKAERDALATERDASTRRRADGAGPASAAELSSS